jgi:16S rRNA (adenine1518-N6/adenine1519-N6)-dimethyltransferase
MPFPRKRFGQHFLRDPDIIARIVAVLLPTPTDHLVEIGPGEGVLTFPVLALSHSLEVIELDRDLARTLQEKITTPDQLTVHATDALRFDFASLQQDERPLRVFGNLPYNISTPLIFHLLDSAAHIQDMLFMLQREVAVRLAAVPGGKDYGRLSVMVQYHYHVERLFDVPAQAFFPAPQVVSSMVRFVPHRPKPYVAEDPLLLASLVKQAFLQRRKKLRNSLRKLIDAAAWAEMPVSPDLRPERVSVADFVEMSNHLSKKGAHA